MNGTRSGMMRTATILGVVFVLCGGSANAQASSRWHDHDRGWSSHRRDHHWRTTEPLISVEWFPVYQRRHDIYYASAAPIVELPHKTVVIDGVVYHEYDGVYYKGGPADYAMMPIASTPGTVAAVATAPGKEVKDTEVINVPNANGSYTPVILQVAKDGTYVGPQGEVYAAKPELEQLKAMYAK